MEARQLGEVALRAALSRIHQRPEDPTGIVLAACEALLWIAALDDWHRKQADPRLNVEQWSELRHRTEDGKTVGGLIYMRNRTAHGLALGVNLLDVLVTWDGTPVTWGDELLTFGTPPAWRPFAELPPPDPGHEKSHGGDEHYRTHVAGRPIPEPIETALGYFERL